MDHGTSSIAPGFQSFTPTWSAPTPPALVNGTMTGRYMQIGKLIIYQMDLVMGSSTTYGSGAFTWTLPVTARTGSVYQGAAYILISGTSFNSGTVANVNAGATSTTTCSIAVSIAQGNYVSSSLPGTMAVSCEIHFTLIYEAA